jgi:predicted N-acetyltransferase YhbS
MTTQPLTLPEHALLQRSADNQRRSTFETPAGSLILHSFCPPSLVASLKADRGLNAFARTPEREHQLLLGLAERFDSMLTLAYTSFGEIVGQVTLAPLEQEWKDIGNAYEIAVEVSTGWRRFGIAHRLLSLALAFESVEESLILAFGLSWHWDYIRLGITPIHYRELIARLFAAHGFAEYLTSEENIRMDPANILLARLGSRLPEESMNRFFHHLLESESLPGF